MKEEEIKEMMSKREKQKGKNDFMKKYADKIKKSARSKALGLNKK